VCKCVLPPNDNPITVNKYISINTSTVRMDNIGESSHMNMETIEGFEFVTDKFNLFATETAFQ
jgi:hypothetical protein